MNSIWVYFLVIVLNQYHAIIFIILHFSSGKVRVKSSGSLGNEISTLGNRDTSVRKNNGRRDFWRNMEGLRNEIWYERN